MVETIIDSIEKHINRQDFERYFKWYILKFDIVDKAIKLESKRKNNLHPVRPRKGDIYLIEFGQNVGKELNDIHMGIIMQDSLKNSVSSTVIVVPISSSSKLYYTHERIIEDDIIEGKLNKLPCKAKAEQLTCVDKARLIHKVGKISSNFLQRLEKKILIILDIE